MVGHMTFDGLADWHQSWGSAGGMAAAVEPHSRMLFIYLLCLLIDLCSLVTPSFITQNCNRIRKEYSPEENT